MIDINLYPAQLRKKKGKTSKFLGGGLNIPKEVIIGLVGGLLTLLLITSICLQAFIFMKYQEHNALKKEWDSMLPIKKSVDVVTNKMRAIQGKINSVKSITGENTIIWSEKFNEISNQIPRGVWLTRIAYSEKSLFIEGSAVAKGQDEMINVHRFASNLKGQEKFLKNLSDLEVGSIQRKRIKDIDIADFSVKARIK